ncbi:MAG: carbohydrate ABC transporter permease, partial [Kouleothrix sp.]
GTAAPLWLPAFWGGAFGTFLLRQYFLTIPFDLAEAARVDGASLIQIFWSIYLPLARPALAALAIYSFLGAWNDLLGPLIYLPADLNKTTLTVGLALFQTQYAGHWTVMMAGALVSIAPMILLFLVAQRQFIEGIALSGVKR